MIRPLSVFFAFVLTTYPTPGLRDVTVTQSGLGGLSSGSKMGSPPFLVTNSSGRLDDSATPAYRDHVAFQGFVSLNIPSGSTPALFTPLYDVIDNLYAKTLTMSTNNQFFTRYAYRSSNIMVWVGGLLMTEGKTSDFTVSGKTISFNYTIPDNVNVTAHYQTTSLQ